LWVTSIGSPDDDHVTSLDSYNNEISLGGYINDTLFTGNDTIIPESSFEQSFLLKFDTLGNLLNAASFVSDGSVVLKSLTHDVDGNLYLAGNFSGTITYDTLSVLADNETALFLMKLLPDGTCAWMQQAGFAFGNDVAVIDDNGVFIVGSYKKQTIIDTFQLAAEDIETLVTAHFTFDGRCDWIMEAGGGCRATYASIVGVSQTHMIITGSVEANRISKDCDLLFGSCIATYDPLAVGHVYLAVCNYTAEMGVLRPDEGYLNPFKRISQSVRFFDLKGRSLPETAFQKSILSGSASTPAGQLIVKDAGSQQSHTINLR
jgi:hypothetical protein